jgi:hypothetical protein
MTEFIVNCIHNDDQFSIVLKDTDKLSTLYEKVHSHLGYAKDSVDLSLDDNILKNDDTVINTTELTDGCDIVTRISTRQAAKTKLQAMGITIGPKALCDASAEGDCNKIQLLIDAGVDVNCTMPEAN